MIGKVKKNTKNPLIPRARMYYFAFNAKRLMCRLANIRPIQPKIIEPSACPIKIPSASNSQPKITINGHVPTVARPKLSHADVLGLPRLLNAAIAINNKL